MYASIGARAIIRPMPQIPDDLRDEAFNSIALARFRIAVDGTAEVELAKATPNPRLNRILLDSLRKTSTPQRTANPWPRQRRS